MSANATDFSQPIYMEEPAAGSGTAATGSGASLADVAVVDLNDPNLLSGELDINTDVNAYDAPPPVPDGTYTVKVKQIDVKDASGAMVRFNVKPGKDGKPPYAYTALEGTIVDPSGKYDGLKVYDRFVSTMQARNGGIPMVRILTCLGVKLPAKASAKVLIDTFLKALANEPSLTIETIWEGGLDEADRQQFEQSGTKQPRVLGMNRFPDDGKGGKQPEMDLETPLGKKHVRAQVRINNYHPAKK